MNTISSPPKLTRSARIRYHREEPIDPLISVKEEEIPDAYIFIESLEHEHELVEWCVDGNDNYYTYINGLFFEDYDLYNLIRKYPISAMRKIKRLIANGMKDDIFNHIYVASEEYGPYGKINDNHLSPTLTYSYAKFNIERNIVNLTKDDVILYYQDQNIDEFFYIPKLTFQVIKLLRFIIELVFEIEYSSYLIKQKFHKNECKTILHDNRKCKYCDKITKTCNIPLIVSTQRRAYDNYDDTPYDEFAFSRFHLHICTECLQLDVEYNDDAIVNVIRENYDHNHIRFDSYTYTPANIDIIMNYIISGVEQNYKLLVDEKYVTTQYFIDELNSWFNEFMKKHEETHKNQSSPNNNIKIVNNIIDFTEGSRNIKDNEAEKDIDNEEEEIIDNEEEDD